ncbi:MAG: hypothetical protein N2517_01460 [Ignavibacteria bacterium]|nr:hypothetical protein [Ignavibacteria bacterium]
MLQTQRFDSKSVESLLKMIEASTLQISELLVEKDKISQRADKIIEVLNERDKLFEKFTEMSKDDNVQLYFRNNTNHFSDRLRKILVKEKENLDIIEENFKLQTEKIKDINKQKKLLLYIQREV